jgi:hypothetical protein
MTYGLAALSASALAGLDLLRAFGCFVRAPYSARPRCGLLTSGLPWRA